MASIYHQTSYLKSQAVRYKVGIDVEEIIDSYEVENHSLMFELEDIFNDKKKEKEKEKLNRSYYIACGKKYHFHISQEPRKDKYLLKVRFTFPSKIINGLPVIFKEEKLVDFFYDEVELYRKYNKVFLIHGFEWPTWDNKDEVNWEIIEEKKREKEAIEEAKQRKEEAKLRKEKGKHLVSHFIPFDIPMNKFDESACVYFINAANYCWAKNKIELMHLMNNYYARCGYQINCYDPKKIRIEKSTHDYFKDSTYAIIFNNEYLMGYINKPL